MQHVSGYPVQWNSIAIHDLKISEICILIECFPVLSPFFLVFFPSCWSVSGWHSSRCGANFLGSGHRVSPGTESMTHRPSRSVANGLRSRAPFLAPSVPFRVVSSIFYYLSVCLVSLFLLVVFVHGFLDVFVPCVHRKQKTKNIQRVMWTEPEWQCRTGFPRSLSLRSCRTHLQPAHKTQSKHIETHSHFNILNHWFL